VAWRWPQAHESLIAVQPFPRRKDHVARAVRLARDGDRACVVALGIFREFSKVLGARAAGKAFLLSFDEA